MKSMETPSSTARRVTRSQTKAAAAAAAAAMNSPITMSMSKKSEKLGSKRRKEKAADGSSTALIDITNGSPIVGVAMGILKTPSSSSLAKKKKVPILTPCSGESLLRRQVKALLKKNHVIQEDEEGAADEVLPKFSFGHHSPSPASRVFLAPTPANTPHHHHVLNLSATINEDIKVNAVMNSFLPSSIKPTELVEEYHLRVTQGTMMRMEDGSKQGGGGSSTLESQKKKKKKRSPISRSLLFEFSSEKSESTSEGGGLIDELCEGVRKISTTYC